MADTFRGSGSGAPPGWRRLGVLASLMVALTTVGTVCFRLLSPATSWIDCLYMAVITLTTVGYREVIELTDVGKLFVIGYLIVGICVVTYSAFQLGQLVVSIELRMLWERRRMQKAIGELHHHYIVCGMGRMGQTICQYLQQRGRPFVVIDCDAQKVETVAHARGWLYIHGDSTRDEVLQAAGIQRARALSSVLATDADNVYVILSARMHNPKLQIVARANDEHAVDKMLRAGANKVVSPINSGAVKIARFMLNPSIEDFLEITDARGSDLELADVLITKYSRYLGKRLSETDLRDRGVMVIGIRRASGERLMPPPGDAELQEGDSLFAFGAACNVNAIMEAAEG